MSCSAVRDRGTSKQLKRVWLLTWESAGDHAQVKDRFVAIISSRYQDRRVSMILEQYYVSCYLALHEQVAYVKSRNICPFSVRYNTIAVPERLQKISSLPSQIPFSDSMNIGGNPWLWARIVGNFDTWIDEDNIEHLKWKERENIVLDDGEITSDWRERSLTR